MVKWHPWDGTPAQLRPVVVLGAGAKWTWEHVATLFGDERTEIVDWYHASEHLWAVAKALHGDDTPETTAWAKVALDHLWRRGTSAYDPDLLGNTVTINRPREELYSEWRDFTPPDGGFRPHARYASASRLRYSLLRSLARSGSRKIPAASPGAVA